MNASAGSGMMASGNRACCTHEKLSPATHGARALRRVHARPRPGRDHRAVAPGVVRKRLAGGHGARVRATYELLADDRRKRRSNGVRGPEPIFLAPGDRWRTAVPPLLR